MTQPFVVSGWKETAEESFENGDKMRRLPKQDEKEQRNETTHASS